MFSINKRKIFYKTFFKYIGFLSINTSSIYFLRKNRTFLKSRFTRTRQWSKVIVYFGLWFNIIGVYSSFLFCYNYTFIWTSFFWVLSLIALAYSLFFFFKSK